MYAPSDPGLWELFSMNYFINSRIFKKESHDHQHPHKNKSGEEHGKNDVEAPLQAEFSYKWVTPEEAVVEKAFEVRLKVFCHEQGTPVEKEKDIHDTRAEHLLVVDNKTKEGVATCRLAREGDGVWRIGRVCVRKDLRSKGIGTLLMKESLTRAREHRLKEVQIQAQTHAIPFYRKFGFQEFGPQFLEDGIPHKNMRLYLF
eukprot:TRINITY_DN11863_c0_g1_i1.p2 TRINITY_DN11863_c0_g1~~TRINITY_DN11863_c0_g1_i1.p2  ORF type:complete len:201 (+),score=21.99 TRINITY_DN11863_c0_g1_i1:344-946(+)